MRRVVSILALVIATVAVADDNTVVLEALRRLKDIDLEKNPAVKSVVLKMLDSVRGKPEFVEIVGMFHLKDQNPALLEIAIAHPADEAGVAATKLLLESQDFALLKSSLNGSNVTNATRTAEALGNAGQKNAVPLLEPLVTDTKRDVALRKQAVHALAQTRDGANALLKLAKDDTLPDDVKFAASSDLNAVRWPDIKAEAAKVLPLPQGTGATPLPPVAELLKMQGDTKRGEEVFKRKTSACTECHRVGDFGTDFAPALTEIGSKLGRDAIYENILDPSAGVSFGFEAWLIKLKNGDEAYGIITSQTEDEVVVKNKTVITHVRKTDIVERQQMKLSIMPANLQASMSSQDLVDLVEFLFSLKKAGAQR